ncbi:MAG: type I glutamate--ammonia ligase [Deltaproteobacteria bacterium RIFCSPLOWO2_01_FULL_45_74]|nr:MAG: type I glutamate--ammonia ligase [Deltaproteobacteria bacterium RIFCSPHIGHO2_01_FULL_43_49]OGQ14403.1 MAG: type I glutamate--ammonia ligase [Deltaproteobacteria bacterium RIFCSPHIGHO2_02_FULL_44_53]OGQ27557.1 MAG: type I glutamate--ammonia ligase [Deltaproteobacteria bacterium RIFCSPHIGHO2_12_FULL_44_21]OGQ30844.1 MAG: type I glutamate--ammonia ligase [Deltaproteobacteria bacterium RIFCSPLOWO2_01_FULL_45_74]OGQ42525.1 MAG: type I glutamate--ammonia ligase [Deltaproteobacteria bacterium 
MSPQSVLSMAKEHKAKMVDFKFIDFVGIWHHFSVPLVELTEGSFEEGFGFDGSSLRGWMPINASDMLIKPDPTTAAMDPFLQEPTLSLICDIYDPITKERYTKDPRYIANKAEKYVRECGIGDTSYFGPEAEFFIFDNIQFDQKENQAYYYIDSKEGRWNSGTDEGPNLGYKPRYKEGYFPVPPLDSQQDIRTEMVLTMEKIGIHVECQHHEVATAGQAEIDMRFDSLTKMADKLMWFKYIVKNVAKKHNKTATFMPKPLFNDNGSGMHTHMSIWKNNTNLFAGDGYGGISKTGLHFIGGVLKHAPALLAFCNPTTNSYRRLVPGFEAPVNLAYSCRNRSAAIRIPMYSNNPKSKRIEFRTPDSSCNPYMAFAAMLMAGVDGIKNKMEPGEPLEKNTYELSVEEAKNVPTVPGSLDQAIKCLQQDYEFLLAGEVFTRDVIETWVEYKIENEVNPIRLRPVPYEFSLYYDI